MNLRRRLSPFVAAAALAAVAVHAAELSDPYAAFEELQSPSTQAWMREQAAATRTALDRVPGRAALLERIHALSESGTSILHVAIAGGRVFYLKSAPGHALPLLCMREAFGGAEKVLVDPEKRAGGAARATIDWFVPAPDGRHVAYGVSAGASGDSVLRVLAADGGQDLPFEIDRARLGSRLAWQPDARAFYYTRVPESQAGARRDANARVYRHVLGRESARDEVVFAAGVGGARDVTETTVPALVLPAESRYAFAVAREGVREELTVHVAEQKDLAAGHPRWHRLVAPEDEVIAIEPWKDEVYLLSHRDAPRRRVLRVKAGAADLASARVVVPQGDSVIESMGLAHDALYLHTMVGGVDRLERSALGLLGARAPEFLRIPFDTAIVQLVTDPRRSGAVLRLQGWIERPAVVEVDAKSGELRDTRLQPPPHADFSAVDQVRLYAPAADGTRVPVTLVYQKSTRLTGENPTLLVGFGAYGRSIEPTFDPALLAWLEHGGVLAIAHVRGGGEYGETWHEAARGATKSTTVTDFVAVSEFLVGYGFTSARRLAIESVGAGAIAVGGALVRRPELFAAAVLRSPLLDMLGYERGAGGPASVPEFGSAAMPQGRAALERISAYHHVRDGMPYPAVLLCASPNDPLVAPWHAAKMAARLQHATSSGNPVLLRVDFDWAESPAMPRSAREQELADVYAFILWQFGDPGFQPPAAPAIVPPKRR